MSPSEMGSNSPILRFLVHHKDVHRTSRPSRREGRWIFYLKWVYEIRSFAGLLAVGLFGTFLVVPASGFGEEQGTAVVKGKNAIEISCGESQDHWQPIVILGPVDAADEEASVSEVIQVTLKYLFLQGSQRRRLTLVTKRTQNAKVVLEINSKQLCDSRGMSGIRTTISGQTQTSDEKAAFAPGYIRILPQQLD